jgi:agmatinase
MQAIPADILALNDTMKAQALEVVAAIESGDDATPAVAAKKVAINASSETLNAWVYDQARAILAKDKFVGVLGGDHSSPLGAIRAISEKYGGEFGILHVDAHADLRDAYQGYQNSHASIFHNVMEAKFAPQKLVQVGIRDFSPGEYAYIQKNSERINTFFDVPLKRRLNRGESWQSVCDDIVGRLPKKVYISFDIDGLSPDLCPNTGTPVPGGLNWDQTLTLFATVAESGRQIVGFDLCEVAQPAPSDSALASAEWDGNVGARILFKLCGWTMVSNGYK